MRKALNNLNSDLAKKHPDYVARVVSDEGRVGRGHLGRFMELEKDVPAILTTSQMLTTGVDVQTCKNVVLVRVIDSMSEFKQIIGRGTRVRDDYGKLYFNILDYTGSATRMFADPDFDGEPATITEEEMDETGEKVGEQVVSDTEEGVLEDLPPETQDEVTGAGPAEKYYVDNGWIEIAAHVVYDLDEDGKKLRARKFTDYTGEKVRDMYPSAAILRSKWSKGEERSAIIQAMEERGISFARRPAASRRV